VFGLGTPDIRRAEPEHLDRLFRAFLAAVAGETPTEPSAEPDPAASSPELEPLLGALEELRHAADPCSILLLVMRFASVLTARGVMYAVAGDRLTPAGGFGPNTGEGSPGGQPLPLDRDSLPGRAFWSARLQRARGEELTPLAPPLLGEPASEAVALPLLGAGGVVAVLYVDAGPSDPPLGDLRALTTLAGTARMAIERLTPCPA